jgi:deoxyhypusine synthase
MKTNDKDLYAKKVKAIEVKPKPLSQLLDDMAQTGFQGRSLAEAVKVYEAMIKDKDATIVMGYAASLSTTGQWKLIKWLIENRYIDILVPTGANISEDIVEAMGYSYYQCKPSVDNEFFFKNSLNRYYDLFGKESDYIEMTQLLADFVFTLEADRPYSSREFLYLCGLWLAEKGIDCIVSAAAKHGVPIFCPALVDSPYGDAMMIARGKGFRLILDNAQDYYEFLSLGNSTVETGVVYIGGGVPKDFIQLFAVTGNLLYPDFKVPNRKQVHKREGNFEEYSYPHKYAVQITTDSPQWGSLSGCTFDEAVSWGKEDPQGQYVQCYCDATIGLPIVTHALAERVKQKRQGIDFTDIFKLNETKAKLAVTA